MRLNPESRNALAARMAEVAAGRTTIDELGVMKSDTSLRVRATTCSRICRVDSGSSGSTSSGSSGSGWNSTSTLAGRGAASIGPARREARSSTISAAEVSGLATIRIARAIGQVASSRVSAQTRPITLAERWTKTDSPTAIDNASSKLSRGRTAWAPSATNAAKARPPTTESDSAARSVDSSSWAIASARLGRRCAWQTSSSRLRE